MGTLVSAASFYKGHKSDSSSKSSFKKVKINHSVKQKQTISPHLKKTRKIIILNHRSADFTFLNLWENLTNKIA